MLCHTSLNNPTVDDISLPTGARTRGSGMIVRSLFLLPWLSVASGLLLNSWGVRPGFSRPVSLAADIATSVDPAERPEELVGDLLGCFQGDFDNYDQVVEDRDAGMSAGPGGGHEHIHCTLRLLDASQVPQQILGRGADGGDQGDDEREPPLAVVSAKYYFNGDANVVFRYRLYSFHACPPNMQGVRGDLVMGLWRLVPPVERLLRARGYDLASFDWGDGGSRHHEGERLSAGDENGASTSPDTVEVAERMLGCEIYWSRADLPGSAAVEDSENVVDGSSERADMGGIFTKGGNEGTVPASEGSDSGDAAKAAAGGRTQAGGAFLGVMGENDDGTWIASQNVDGLEILIKDNLKLWRDRLWVNDRGFDRDGSFVYGNQRGVPYKMRRVVSPGPLEWTLGEGCRTAEAYAEKMAAIGVTPGQRFGPPAPTENP